MCIREASLQERRLGTHDSLRTLTVTAGDLIVVRHALVHLGKLALPARPVRGRTSSARTASRRSSRRSDWMLMAGRDICALALRCRRLMALMSL